MKTYFLCLLLCLGLVNCLAQGNRFSITRSLNVAGGSTPTITPIDMSSVMTLSQVNNLVKFFLDSSKLDFECIYNGCQNRAMVMSLLLKKKGIKHYKIWNFNPNKISIFNSNDALDVDDVLKLKTNRIFWDYHVAIALPVKINGMVTDTLVLDPAFVKRPLAVKEWIALQHSPNSSYTFLDPRWYNFVTTMNGSNINCNGATTQLNLPVCFPQLITGDFYYYDNYNQVMIAEEIATNEQVTKAAKELIYKLPDNDPSKAKLIALVSDNFEHFKRTLKGEITVVSDHPFFPHLKTYRMAWAKSAESWKIQLAGM